MKYQVSNGVVRSKRNIKKYIAGITAAAAIIGTAAVPAFAANDYCGASANGCEHSQANTVCAAHGSFGAFGEGNNFAGGASGDRTAYNNSTLCGNPSPNSAAATLGDTPN
jgi:hypothetical protein